MIRCGSYIRDPLCNPHSLAACMTLLVSTGVAGGCSTKRELGHSAVEDLSSDVMSSNVERPTGPGSAGHADASASAATVSPIETADTAETTEPTGDGAPVLTSQEVGQSSTWATSEADQGSTSSPSSMEWPPIEYPSDPAFALTPLAKPTNESPLAIAAHPAGGFMVSLLANRGFGDVPGTGVDAFLVHIAEDGTVADTLHFGEDGAESPDLLRMDEQGNAYVAGLVRGQFLGEDDTSEDVYVVKINPKGALEWGHRFDSSNWVVALDLQLEANGNVLLLHSDGAQTMLTRFGEDGALLLDVEVVSANFAPYRLREAPSGRLYVAGEAQPNEPGGYLPYVAELDADGHILAQMELTSATNGHVQQLEVASDGRIYLLSNQQEYVPESGLIFDVMGSLSVFDPELTLLERQDFRELDGSSYASLAIAPDGTLAVVGQSVDLAAATERHRAPAAAHFVHRFNKDGERLLTLPLTLEQTWMATALAIDSQGAHAAVYAGWDGYESYGAFFLRFNSFED